MGVEREQQNDSSEPDLASVDAADWPQREFPSVRGCRGESVPIVIKQSIVNAVRRHGQQHPDVEVCGVLVGRGYRDAEGHFIYIEGFIRGDHAGSQAAQVTFTGDTWNHIYEVLDEGWPDSRILGWYHTHPGFGIFLSGMDLFIHQSFFGAPDQVALVYDPLSGDEGLFVWEKGSPVRRRFLVEDDAEEVPALQNATAAASEDTPDGNHDLSKRLDGIRRRLNALLILVVLLWVVAIVWPIGAFWLLGHYGNGTGNSAPTRIQEPLPITPNPRPETLDRGGQDFPEREDSTADETIDHSTAKQTHDMDEPVSKDAVEHDQPNAAGKEPPGRSGDEVRKGNESPVSSSPPENTRPPAKEDGGPAKSDAEDP